MQILHLSVFVLVSNKQCLLYIRKVLLCSEWWVHPTWLQPALQWPRQLLVCVLAQLQQCLLCQGTVNLPVSLQRVDILDAEAPGFAMNQLLQLPFLCFIRLPYFRKGRTLRTSLPRHSFQGHGSFCGSDNTGFPWFLCRAGSLSAPMMNEIHRREPWKPKLVIQKHPWEDIMLVSPLFMSWVVRLKVLKNQSMLLFLHFWKIFYLFHSRNSQLYHQLRIAAVMMNYSPSQTRGRIHKCDSWAFKEVQIEYVYSNMVLFLIMKAYF